MSHYTLFVASAAALTILATGGYSLLPLSAYDPACKIKGNISIQSAERIYHVPGQEDYAATRISIQHGERWFCSEEDAQAAGWRRARR